MSFKDFQDLANTALFSGAAFGEAITYTPAGGTPVEIQGVYFKIPVDLGVGGGSVADFEHRLDVRVADISGGPKREATVVVRGVTYVVRDFTREDDAGVSSLMLEA